MFIIFTVSGLAAALNSFLNDFCGRKFTLVLASVLSVAGLALCLVWESFALVVAGFTVQVACKAGS